MPALPLPQPALGGYPRPSRPALGALGKVKEGGSIMGSRAAQGSLGAGLALHGCRAPLRIQALPGNTTGCPPASLHQPHTSATLLGYPSPSQLITDRSAPPLKGCFPILEGEGMRHGVTWSRASLWPHFSATAGGTDKSTTRRDGRGRATQQLHAHHGPQPPPSCAGTQLPSRWVLGLECSRAQGIRSRMLTAFPLNSYPSAFGAHTQGCSDLLCPAPKCRSLEVSRSEFKINQRCSPTAERQPVK